MRFLTARRLVLTACVPVLLLFSVVPGCSSESEGERCGDDLNAPNEPGATNDSDCASGLVCVAASTLANNQANRCCNADPTIVNDSRCIRATGVAVNNTDAAEAGATSEAGGTGNTADAGGTSGSGGTSNTADAGGAGGSGGTGGSNTDAGL